MSDAAAGYGALGAIVLIVGVAAGSAIDSTSNFTPAEATVFRIDRTCSFTRITEGGPRKKVSVGIEQDCSATDEFKKIAASPKRSMDVAGSALVKVSYTAPQDGSSQTAELKFDGHDDEFYALKAGHQVKILVANKDLTNIRLR